MTENYNPRILGGKLTVTKIEIEVTVLSGKNNYDGLPLEVKKAPSQICEGVFNFYSSSLNLT